MNYIIVLGNAVEGLSFIGPFPTHEEATDYAESYCEVWVVTQLHPKDQE